MEPVECSIGVDNADDADLMLSGSMVYQYLGITDPKCETPLILSVLSSLLERATQRNDKNLQQNGCNALDVDDGASYGNNFNTNNTNDDDYDHYYDASYEDSPKKELSIFHGIRAPTISIDDYITRIFKYAKCSPSCFVLAYAYITRVTTSCSSKVADNFPQEQGSSPFLYSPEASVISSFNVHRLLITSVMVAAKFIDDRHYNNAYYAKIGGVSIAEMNALELALLGSLGYRLHMSLRAFDTFCSDFGKEAAMQAATEASIKSPPLKFAPNQPQIIQNGTSLAPNPNANYDSNSVPLVSDAPQLCSNAVPIVPHQSQLSANESSLSSNSVHLSHNPTTLLASNCFTNFDEENKPSIALQLWT